MTHLYLVKRGPKPDYHKAPFHPVIICDRKRVAREEAGHTGDQATVWERSSARDNGCGWLIVRWQGFDIDYGIVHYFRLPDGTGSGFWRDYEAEDSVKNLLPGAVWWSDKPMPEWLARRGVVYPPDKFTQQWVLDRLADDGCIGLINRELPACWKSLPKGEPHAV